MDKKTAFVESSLFLLFAKAESDPCQAAERTSLAIKGAVYSVFPKHRYENGVKLLRTQWFQAYISELIEQLRKLSEEFHPQAEATE